MEIGYFCGNPQQTADRALENRGPGEGHLALNLNGPPQRFLRADEAQAALA